MLKPFYNRFSLTALVVAVLLSPVAARQQKAARDSRVGPYTISSFAQINGTQTIKGGWEGTITSTGGKPIQMTSSQYSLTAMHVDVDMALVRRTLKPTNVTATGKIKIVIHNKIKDSETNEIVDQKTVATCDKAVFTATEDIKDRGKVKLLGNFHSVTTTPGSDTPYELDGDDGQIDFLPDGRLGFKVISESGNGSFKGTPIERAPKGKR